MAARPKRALQCQSPFWNPSFPGWRRVEEPGGSQSPKETVPVKLPEGSTRREWSWRMLVVGSRRSCTGLGRRENQNSIDPRYLRRMEEEGKGRKLSVPERGGGVVTVLKAISHKSPLARSPEALFPASEGPHESRWHPADLSLDGCGRSGGRVVPGEDGLQPLREPRVPHPSLTCRSNPQSPRPPLSATEGRPVPVVHVFEPHSVPLGF